MAKEDKLPATSGGAVATFDYGEDVGAGFQNQTKDDLALPFIDILQPGSPEVLQAQDSGAIRAGMIINRVTGEVIDGKKGMPFIAAVTEHCYTEWLHRPKAGEAPQANAGKQGGGGGGFVARHELSEEIVKQARATDPFKVFRMPSGNDLVETFYVFGVQVEDDWRQNSSHAPVGIAFGSTKIKAYKSFSYVARSIQVLTSNGSRVNPPLFSHVYRMTTQLKTKDGNNWFIPVITFDGKDAKTGMPSAEACRLVPTDELYQAARGVMKAYESGALKADYSKTSASDVNDQAQGDGKAPF